MPTKFRIPLTLLAQAPLSAAIAAGDPVPTGIMRIGPSVFIFVIAAAVLITLVGSAAARPYTRRLGERLARLRIARELARRSKHVMSDALLPGAYGGIIKVDHVVLTPAALLCIRSVHAHGMLAGGESEPQWTVVEGSVRRRFLNPLIQNEGRARALRKALPDIPVESLVVITGKLRWSSPLPSNVMLFGQLDDYLQKQVLGPARVKDSTVVWQRFESVVLTDAATRKDFAAQVSFS